MTPVTVDVDGRAYRLFATDAGLACCAVEFIASTFPGRGLDQVVDDAFAEPAAANVLVVSGTVTHVMAPAVRALYDQMPEPRRVIAFGACTATGGPYWDSYAVAPGIGDTLPVDLHVAGCPPRPEALVDALRTLGSAVAS